MVESVDVGSGGNDGKSIMVVMMMGMALGFDSGGNIIGSMSGLT